MAMEYYSIINNLHNYFLASMSVPTNITAARSSNAGTLLTVNWYPVSLEDAGGFYMYNLILSAFDGNIKIVQFTQQISYNHSSTIFVGLLPSTRYSLQMNIIVINTNGEEISEPLSQPLEIMEFLFDSECLYY